MFNIVFVCTGNMCRSPMAEAILRHKLLQIGHNDFFVTSSGIHANNDQPAAPLAVEVCQEHAIDLSRHLTRTLNPKELFSSDLIFAMEPVQKDFLVLFFPALRDKVALLGSWPQPDSKKGMIPDPMGGDLKDYRKTFDVISRNIDRIMPSLLELV
jgi:protein-tyrosine-phosphatase